MSEKIKQKRAKRTPKANPTKQVTYRMYQEDLDRIDRIATRYGDISKIDAIRKALTLVDEAIKREMVKGKD